MHKALAFILLLSLPMLLIGCATETGEPIGAVDWWKGNWEGGLVILYGVLLAGSRVAAWTENKIDDAFFEWVNKIAAIIGLKPPA